MSFLKKLVQAKKTLLAGVVMAGIIAGCSGHSHGNPLTGAWGPKITTPQIAIHASILPQTDKVWMCFAKDGALGTKCWVLDPATGLSTDASLPYAYDMMCGGHVLLDTGRVSVYGGRINANQTARYNYLTNTWTPGPLGLQPSYYPSAVRHGDGQVYVFFGNLPSIDRYNPHDYSATYMTRLPASANLAAAAQQLYPRVFRVANGTFFLAGTEQQTRSLNLDTMSWSNMGSMLYGRRYDGSAVPLPGNGCEFMIFGGDTPATSRSAERINVCEAGPAWRATGGLTYARRFANAIVLPDGKVLALGGKDTPNTLKAEMYDPATEVWTVMAAQQVRRDYHSVAVLRPDATVLSAGGVDGATGKTYEVYSPPYLFSSPGVLAVRPALSVVTVNNEHGATAEFTSADAATVTRMTMVRPGPGSHNYNGEQQHYELAFTVNAGVISATMPSNVYHAPDGWYMTFAINDQGVPSIAAWTWLGGGTPPPPPPPIDPPVVDPPVVPPASNSISETFVYAIGDNAPFPKFSIENAPYTCERQAGGTSVLRIIGESGIMKSIGYPNPVRGLPGEFKLTCEVLPTVVNVYVDDVLRSSVAR